jgi:hypothetical protein
VVFTVLVNGSAASSQARSSSSSAGTGRPSAAFKHGEFLRGQRQAAPGADRDAAGRVQAEVTVFQSGRQRHGGAPAKGPDAGDQLGEVKRLGQVVIGAKPEALDPFPDRPGRGQHQHPGL